MKYAVPKFIWALVGLFLFLPSLASAHQPRLVQAVTTTVDRPEVSKAYYGQLIGEPQIFVINATSSFNLYVNILVPDISGQKKDVSAVVLKNGTELALLDAATTDWKTFWEPFGRDSYWQGKEYKARVEAGTYEIRVWSSNNDSKYSLAIGEIEAFDARESVNALKLIPQLKREFFNESPAGFALSIVGFSYLAIMLALGFAGGLLYRFILKRLAKGTGRGRPQNIGVADRVVRAGFGVALLTLAITISWSPFLLFFSGFCFFEAMFSWCGFYAAIGKSTCPIE